MRIPIKSKHLLFASLFLSLSFGFSCAAKKSDTVTISGQLKNVPKGFISLALEEDINRKKKRSISAIPIDETGRFSVQLDLEPHIYSLNIRDKNSVMLAIDKGQQIVISGDADGSTPFVVTGSEDTAKLEAYEKFRKESLDRLVISVRNQIKELTDKKTPENDPKFLELARLEIENYNKHKDEMIGFVKDNMGTSVAVYATSIRWDGDKNVPFLNDLAKRFDAAHPNLAVTTKLKEKVQILTNNSVGGTVSDIAMPDKNGQTVTLKSIKAKYVLIDFWGSWCAPCRRESGELAALYEKFKPQGFEIYGVGLESERELWLGAIEQDKRVWANVSTFQEFETPVAFEYGVTSLPANFLIDSNGKVVAKNLHGKELKDTIESLFK